MLRQHTLIMLTLMLPLTACDRDPLSARGKVFLPVDERPTPGVTSQAAGEPLLQQAASPVLNLPTAAPAGVIELEWDDLIPPDWRPDPALVALYQRGEIDDTDPRVIETRRRVAEPNPPANRALDGKRVKLPGFVVPLEVGAGAVTEFLLVPYHGACVHVPPPPTNQTVYVRAGEEGGAPRTLFETVWVTGRLQLEPVESGLAEAGYTLHAESVEPYE
jgi:hypothetical protein